MLAMKDGGFTHTTSEVYRGIAGADVMWPVKRGDVNGIPIRRLQSANINCDRKIDHLNSGKSPDDFILRKRYGKRKNN